MSSDVKVGIKLKPLNKREKDDNLPMQWIVKGNSIVSLDETAKNTFNFDYVFDVNTTNAYIFDSIIKPIADAAIDGYNGTIFCYGQFNCGKTCTMVGSSEEQGIIPYTIDYIFNVISNIVKREFLLRVSYIEVCDEKVNDLLNKNGNDLKLYKDDIGQVIVKCKEEITNCAKNMLSAMKKGIKNKNILEINRNEHIASHSIFRIVIESQDIEEDSKNFVQVSQLNFVDLAGFKKTHDTNAIEVCQVDASLSTFESRIKQLNDSGNDGHTDTSSSKLIELLQLSLGANAVMAIICTITPVALEETYYTLLFASEVKNIKTKPLRNEVVSDTPLLIRYAKQLTKLQTELERMTNGNTCTEPEVLESNKLQQTYHINYLLEERIKLLKSQIISGCTKDSEESYKYKSTKKQLWCNPGTFKHYLPVYNIKTGLPTIKEISPEKPYRNNIMQSVDVINQTLQTAFTDFELQLIDCEGAFETKGNTNVQNDHINCTESELSTIRFINNNCYLTPEKQDSCVQTSSNHASPTTPKSVLRNYILDLTKDLTELREFTTLEKQLICKENHCCRHNSEEESSKQSTCPDFKSDESNKYSSKIVAQLEEEKTKLTEDLELKIHELNEIKNDIQSLKLDIGKLEETIYLLTNENMEMSTKLSAEKERSKETEINLQKTIDDLYGRISKITDEKINLESDLTILNEQLESFRIKASEDCNDEQLFSAYQNKIDELKTENIELSAIIAGRNEELESIKESKSLLYDHECVYKDKVATLKEKNQYLTTENNELSTELIDKIEENDMLKEQFDILKNKMSLIENTNFDENDMDQLRSENNILKAEIVELKMRITILSDENVKFSHNLLESMENNDNPHNGSISNNVLHLSADSPSLTTNETANNKVLRKENYEELRNKVVMLQDNVNHLSRLNKKLSDLKLSSCSQCAHLKNLNESRRALKIEAKILNHKLEDLQKKFNKKCADIETLKLKATQEPNFNLPDISLNTSFTYGMNVSFVEEKVQHLSDELQTLKNDRDKLSILYQEKCDELEKLHDEVGDARSADGDSKPQKHVYKNETRIEQIQNSIDQVKEDIDELKKNSTSFASVLSKFRAEKASLLDEINILKNINEELQQKVSDKEILEATATEKAQILENELLNMSKEIEEYCAKEKIIRSEKLTLEVELEDMKAEKENRDVLITGLHQTIDDLNECISSLKNELDLVTNQKIELTLSTETIKHTYIDEVELLRKQCSELEREKQESIEAGTRATLWAKALETDVEKLQMNLEKQENLYKELQRKVLQLENLLQESKDEKATLNEKLQALEVRLVDSKESTVIKYKNEFETIEKKFEEYTKESEMKLNKINETLNKYVEESDYLTQELVKLRDIESEFKNLQDQVERTCNEDESLIDTNKKLMKELDVVKECMIKELKALKYKVNSVDFLNKTADDIFLIFLQTLMSKEEEIIKKMRDIFEKDKQKLVDEVRQSADAEKRVTLWAKELETEIEKLQMDLTKKEGLCNDQHDKLCQLEHLLKESTYEKEILKEKMDVLEIDFSNLQSDFDKQCNVDIHQKDEAVIVALKREKEAQQAFKNKEIELQSKIKSVREIYEKRIEELICNIDSYKTQNIELKNNIEDLEANEKQLKNIVEANNSELKTNNQTMQKMSLDLEQLTEAYNEVNREVEQKTSRIESITTLLKNKCDMLSEYKTKLDAIIPDYEILTNQVKERKESIERYKEEIEKIKMEKDKQIAMIKDKLNSEEIERVGLNKQLTDLNNKNVALLEELHNLKEKSEELQRTNTKLERKIRNSTSKLKAKEEMDELRDMNKRLQNNLEGASNRISELQEGKNKILKELVDLKGQYELQSQENVEIKQTLLMYKSKQTLPCLSEGDSKYDELVQEKNKVALELEGKKLLLNQKDKEMEEHVRQLRDLMSKKNELVNQLTQYTTLICDRDMEISDLKHKLQIQQSENKLISELEAKLKILEQENKNLDDQLQTFKMKSQMNMKRVDDIELCNEKVYFTLKKEKSELQMKLNAYENKLELRNNSTGLKSASPTLQNNKRRRSRNEMFNQRRQLESETSDTDTKENDETCHALRKRIQELELQLVSKNGQIAALEIQIQSENFPYQEKCKELEELLLAFRKKNSELSSETRKLQRTLTDINTWECDVCRRWRVNRREQACQTMPTNNREPFSTNNGILNDHTKLMKLEREKAIIKDICRARCRQVKDLEDKIKVLEQVQNTSTKRIEFLQERSVSKYMTATHFDKHFDLENNKKSAMKEGIPTNILELSKSSNYGRNIWNNY